MKEEARNPVLSALPAQGSQRARVRKSQAGTALVELALIVPVLILLLIGMIDIGRLWYAAMEVAEAAHAGAQYGARDVLKSTDTTGIKNAALNNAQDIIPLTVATVTVKRTACTISNGTPSGCVTCATGSCGVAAPAGIFVEVRTQATIHMLLEWPGLGLGPVTVYGKAKMRAA